MQQRSIWILVAVTMASLGLKMQDRLVDIVGTWRADTPDGPTDVIVRPDSSASVGEETVRWRVVGDSVFIAFGDEWMVYGAKRVNDKLTFSGGDLEEPMELTLQGPATPRPPGVDVPPAPPADRRATP